LGHKFEAAGNYFLQVEDRNYMGSGNHFYFIQAGSFPYVTSSWPLAMRASDQGERLANEVAALDVAGFNLGPQLKFRPTPGTGPRSVFPFAPTGQTLNAIRFESSPFAEFVESEPNDTPERAQPLPIPSAVSGRIKAGFGIQDSGFRESASPPLPKSEIRNPKSPSDHYSFTAHRGDRLTIETIARRIGSPIDTCIEILDADGRPLPRHTLRAVAETYTVLRDDNSRTKGLRLQNWDDLQPNDFLMIGGEVLKLQALPLGPDEDAKFFDRLGPRVGYFGTTPEAHAINSPVFKVEVHPPGATFPPNGMPVVPLYWQNDDASGLGSDSQLLFDVPADGKYVVRVRDSRQLSGDDFVYRLAIRPRHEDFRVWLDADDLDLPRGGTLPYPKTFEDPFPAALDIPRGGSLPVAVKVDRRDGFNGPIDVRIEGLPEGVTATPTRVEPDKFSAIFTLTAAENAPQPSLAKAGEGAFGLRVIAMATIDGQRVERMTASPAGPHVVTITSPPDLTCDVEPKFAEIAPGQEFRFTATIERRHGFKGRVPVDVLNLPHGLRVLDVGLNGVLINETETSRSFVVTCDPWADPGPVQFFAAARREPQNERHAGVGIRVKVKNPRTVATGAADP
jgi:hypothetical protein